MVDNIYRFATHIIFILLFGQLMSRIAARTIFLSSVAFCGLFNTALASIAFVQEQTAFTGITFLFIILSMIGDSGVFSSIYVLAGQSSFTLKTEKLKKKEANAVGPAWIETMYGCGSMLGSIKA